MNLNEWMNEAKAENENGKSLMQISLETYLTEILGFQLLEAKLIKNHYEEEFQFVATNGVNEYVFKNEYYDPKAFAPHQQVLILTEIRGQEGVLPVEHYIWLTRDNKNDKFLFTPLAELMSGSQNDQELRYAVEYLKNAFQDLKGFEYKEEESNDLSSFSISLDGQIILRQSFSNAIQCNFQKEALSSFQIVFKGVEQEKVTRELDEFIQFAHTYLAKNITLDQHNLSDLHTFLGELKLQPQLYTNAVLPSKKVESTPLFNPLVIETADMFSYHQIQVSIMYHYDKKTFIVEANYLFRTFVTECATVEEVKHQVTELIELLQTSNRKQV